MARFSVYRTDSPQGLLLDVQVDALSHLNVRVVAPLLPLAKAPKAASRLNPVFTIDGETYVMVTQYMLSVPAKVLKQTVCTLAGRYDEIVAALDVLFQGI